MTLTPPDTDRQDDARSADANDGLTDAAGLREEFAGTVDANQGVPKAQLKELVLLEAGTDPEDLERPYLEGLPDQYAARLTLFEWLQFALDRGGTEHTLVAIDYYREIGWVDEEAADSLRDHVRVFQDGADGSGEPFGTADHLVSLVYVARLASMT
jgi:flagellar protein FlaE